jgi:hypothetical protein
MDGNRANLRLENTLQHIQPSVSKDTSRGVHIPAREVKGKHTSINL